MNYNQPTIEAKAIDLYRNGALIVNKITSFLLETIERHRINLTTRIIETRLTLKCQW